MLNAEDAEGFAECAEKITGTASGLARAVEDYRRDFVYSFKGSS